MITTQFIGILAQQILAKHPSGVVMGVTSRGVFVRVIDWVVFLSTERFRGPLTLNITGDLRALRLIQPGEEVFISRYRQLSFASNRAQVETNEAEEWSAPPRPGNRLPVEERRDALEWISARVPPPPELFDDRELTDLVEALQAGQAGSLGSGLEALLGRGPGLTPAGDDAIAGMMLAFYRWNELFPAYFDRERFHQQVIRSARQRTTMLSANLIECAALGQADERLIEALDGMVTGTPDRGTCVELLSGWGSTSGACALAGMRAALEAA